MWSPAQRAYQKWIATPRKQRPRNLLTRQQIAKDLGVDEDTLLDWECMPNFWNDAFEMARAIVGREMASVMEAMVEKANMGSVSAAKLCVELLGVHKAESDVNLHIDDRLYIVTDDPPEEGSG